MKSKSPRTNRKTGRTPNMHLFSILCEKFDPSRCGHLYQESETNAEVA